MMLLLPFALAAAIGFFYDKDPPPLISDPLNSPQFPWRETNPKTEFEPLQGNLLPPMVAELPRSQIDPSYSTIEYKDGVNPPKPSNTVGDYMNVSIAPPWDLSLAPPLLPEGRVNPLIPIGDWEEGKLDGARGAIPDGLPISKLTRDGVLGATALYPDYQDRTADLSQNDAFRKEMQSFVDDSSYNRHPHEGMLPGEVREWDDQAFNSSHEYSRFLRPNPDPPTERLNYMSVIERNPKALVNHRQSEDPLSVNHHKRQELAPNKLRLGAPTFPTGGKVLHTTGSPTTALTFQNDIESAFGLNSDRKEGPRYGTQQMKKIALFDPTTVDGMNQQQTNKQIVQHGTQTTTAVQQFGRPGNPVGEVNKYAGANSTIGSVQKIGELSNDNLGAGARGEGGRSYMRGQTQVRGPSVNVMNTTPSEINEYAPWYYNRKDGMAGAVNAAVGLDDRSWTSSERDVTRNPAVTIDPDLAKAMSENSRHYTADRLYENEGSLEGDKGRFGDEYYQQLNDRTVLQHRPAGENPNITFVDPEIDQWSRSRAALSGVDQREFYDRNIVSGKTVVEEAEGIMAR